MIALGKPYVSDFLLNSIQKNNYPVISTPEARELIGDLSLNWISEKEASRSLSEDPDTRVYTNSENTIGWLENHADKSRFPEMIRTFKNKLRFREMLASVYPDFFFTGVRFEKLEKLEVNKLNFPLMIKPAVGFFSVAVHRIEHAGEWKTVLYQINEELKIWKGTYPVEVIDTTEFILEECIEGEEYAIDAYFDQQGEVVVLNILHHVFSSGKDVSDRVYTSSEHIISQHLQGVRDFLALIGEKAELANFPLHVEVRINPEGKITPIEVNPLRFGGWCTTGDLSWYAYGINSYEYYFSSKRPDWSEIFRSRQGKKYSVVVLDNNSGLPVNQIKSFNYELLRKDFEKVLDLRKVDYRKYGVFGFLFLETSAGNEEELTRILNSDLKKYIRTS